MRLIAEATLLSPGLDEQLGIEAQRLIGVRDAVRAEIKALEVLRRNGYAVYRTDQRGDVAVVVEDGSVGVTWRRR